jgi:thiol-disulfide isomerase/thioredoxin
MRIRVTVLIGLLLATTSCAARPAGPPPAAAEVLRFTATTVDGATFDGSTLAGKPAVLWFWAPWCGTCAGQALSVAETAAKYDGRVGVVGVAGLGDRAAMHEFIADTEVGGVVHLDDQSGAVWRLFGVTEQSTYVLIDPAGTVVHRGWLDSVRFEERVAALAA